MPSIISDRYQNKQTSTDPGFVYSSGYPSRIPRDKPTKNPYPVTIINPASVPSEIPSKYTSHVPK